MRIKNNAIRRALHIVNPLALITMMSLSDINHKIYLAFVVVVLTIFSVVIFTKKTQWLEKSFFVAYGLFFAVCTLTFPMMIVFALTAGLWFTIRIVLLLCLPILLLLVANGIQIFRKKP